MAPAVLAGATHDHETAMFKLEAVRFFAFDACFTLEQKASRAAKRQRSNGGIFTELGLIVGVHAHIVSAISVVIEQDMIELSACLGLDALLQGSKGGRGFFGR